MEGYDNDALILLLDDDLFFLDETEGVNDVPGIQSEPRRAEGD